MYDHTIATTHIYWLYVCSGCMYVCVYTHHLHILNACCCPEHYPTAATKCWATRMNSLTVDIQLVMLPPGIMFRKDLCVLNCYLIRKNTLCMITFHKIQIT